ncbi:hypothetical protein IC614_05240 [Allosphingosinicella flava]|uniref:Pentapeptide MXKDX repeat protein n=1 Tax=Allosphingosinicella flava TaxID=2771430 RepID=A0A7T2GLC9_9SPHN|nr:hypothetical protein [Sphingosinicella flava]QPQ55984.1 hypothetical protein IC614_05240 [Sphingosinicella flava]
MRALLSKVMTGSMVAGAALLVAACGGSEDAAVNNTAMTEMDSNDMMMDGMTNDMQAVDSGANMTMDSNMTMDANMSATNTTGATTATNTTADADMTNGM